MPNAALPNVIQDSGNPSTNPMPATFPVFSTPTAVTFPAIQVIYQ
jgi:hypothetical protein